MYINSEIDKFNGSFAIYTNNSGAPEMETYCIDDKMNGTFKYYTDSGMHEIPGFYTFNYITVDPVVWRKLPTISSWRC